MILSATFAVVLVLMSKFLNEHTQQALIGGKSVTSLKTTRNGPEILCFSEYHDSSAEKNASYLMVQGEEVALPKIEAVTVKVLESRFLAYTEEAKRRQPNTLATERVFTGIFDKKSGKKNVLTQPMLSSTYFKNSKISKPWRIPFLTLNKDLGSLETTHSYRSFEQVSLVAGEIGRHIYEGLDPRESKDSYLFLYLVHAKVMRDRNEEYCKSILELSGPENKTVAVLAGAQHIQPTKTLESLGGAGLSCCTKRFEMSLQKGYSDRDRELILMDLFGLFQKEKNPADVWKSTSNSAQAAVLKYSVDRDFPKESTTYANELVSDALSRGSALLSTIQNNLSPEEIASYPKFKKALKRLGL